MSPTAPSGPHQHHPPDRQRPDAPPPPRSRPGHRPGTVRSSIGTVDPDARYLLYLHAKVVEDHGLPAADSVYGAYRYDAILDRLASFGFVVVSEVRPRDARSSVYADRVVAQIDTLLGAGVLPDHVTVVGASKGAYIAALASHRAQNPALRFVLLAMCDSSTVRYMRDQGSDLYGDILAVRDIADTAELAGSCAELFGFSAGIGRHDEVVVEVGTGHGILYGPLDEWVLPTVHWAEEPR